jgi:proline dehydrogenase
VAVSIESGLLLRLATNERFQRAATGLPGGSRAAWRAASQYVAGRSLAEALATARGLLDRGHGVSIDLFGGPAGDARAAARVLEDYLALAAALPPPPADAWLSVDLTHLGLDGDAPGTAQRLAGLAGALPPGRRVQVGAEDATHTDKVLACVLDVAGRGLADRLGATVQANLLRSPTDARALSDAGLHVRLVKGAYPDSPHAHPHGEPTDVAYMRLAFQLLDVGAAWSMATHDGRLREAILLSRGPVTVEQSLGVRPEVLAQLRDRGIPTRVYLPYGPDWFRYWLRLVAESRRA